MRRMGAIAPIKALEDRRGLLEPLLTGEKALSVDLRRVGERDAELVRTTRSVLGGVKGEESISALVFESTRRQGLLEDLLLSGWAPWVRAAGELMVNQFDANRLFEVSVPRTGENCAKRTGVSSVLVLVRCPLGCWSLSFAGRPNCHCPTGYDLRGR